MPDEWFGVVVPVFGPQLDSVLQLSDALNAAFVSRRRVSTENQLSTRFSHDDEEGVKCRCQRDRFGSASHLVISGPCALTGCRVEHHMNLEVDWDVQIDDLEEGQYVSWPCVIGGCRRAPRRWPRLRCEQICGAVCACSRASSSCSVRALSATVLRISAGMGVVRIDGGWNAWWVAVLGVVAAPSVSERARIQLGAGSGGSMSAASSANPSFRFFTSLPRTVTPVP